jgi:hypothetical protein
MLVHFKETETLDKCNAHYMNKKRKHPEFGSKDGKTKIIYILSNLGPYTAVT